MKTVTNQSKIKQLLELKSKVRNQILGNDYYIAKDLKDLEKKIDERIKELSQMPDNPKEVI